MAKTLFISYSHDSEEHKAWVKQFAEDLASIGGFTVLLDQNLPKGASFTRFMELGINVADKVLVIGTPDYKKKAVSGNGVAFEEAIIGSELMRDIDSTKYYPILRRGGSFEESFPPILHGRNGDDMRDDTKYIETLKEIVNSIANEQPLPEILKASQISIIQPEVPALNVNFSVNILYETQFNVPTGRVLGIAFGVTVTNVSLETKYVSSPFFKLSVPIEKSADTFTMLNVVNPMSFPAKLERGQQFSISYKLVPGNVEMFSNLLAKDSSVTVQAIVTTTLGDVAKSEPYPIANLVKDFKYIR